jgi:GxxExxY protein
MPYEDEEPPLVDLGSEMRELTHAIIGAAIEVHRRLGPGLDEISYERALCIEFRLRGIEFVRQVGIDVMYKGEVVGERRLDIIVAGKVVIELKAVEELTELHKAQLLTYVKLTGHKLGLLMNFNTIMLRDGLARVIQS